MVRIDIGFRFFNGIVVLYFFDGRFRIFIVAEIFIKFFWFYEMEGSGKVRDRKFWGKLLGIVNVF